MKIGPVEMTALIRGVFQELTAGIPAERIAFRVSELPPCRGDAALLRHVWANLLGNALKYSSGRARAEIEVGGRQEAAECVYFVRDNGAGFDMKYVHKLFGPFQRLHSVREFEGTGVGLAIVQRIVRRHGGRVWAEGEVGAGATFGFALPLRKA
jgi:two-component system sensor kinase